MSEGIQESSEVLDGAAKIFNDVAAAKENDGEISVFEMMKLAIADSPAAVKAAMGAGKIPAELGDLDPAEVEALLPKAVACANAGLRLFAAMSK